MYKGHRYVRHCCTEQVGTVSLCGCVCWLTCHAVNSQHSGPELLSGDWSPAGGAGSAVTLEEEPVKAGGGWRGNWQLCKKRVSALCCKPRHPYPASNCLVFQSHLASFTRSVLKQMSGFKAVFCPCCLLLCWFADKYIWYLIIMGRREKGKFKPFFPPSEFE